LLEGQTALMGAFLWQQVNTVVILQKNQRQLADPFYAGLLSRLRVGACDGAIVNAPAYQCDFDVLRTHLLSNIQRVDLAAAESFHDASFIVG
jgi:hypothetical protein